MIKIAIINESTVVKDEDAQACVLALQTQVSRDFAPIWGVDAILEFLAKGTAPIAGEWQLVILDDSDQADALGYHELTADGAPIGKAFAKSDLDAGTLWTVTASHELLEMLADPDINLTAEVDGENGEIALYAYEVCDAVESDALGYGISNSEGAGTFGPQILVSDFVTPAWFMPNGQAPFSFLKNVTQPFALAPGGYISILQAQSSQGWQQVTAEKVPDPSLRNFFGLRMGGPPAPRGSRRARRALPDDKWRRSEKRI
jgi:hypothetical protein